MTANPVKFDQLFVNDPLLKNYNAQLQKRFQRVNSTETRLMKGRCSISEFASAHEYYGLHDSGSEWIFRELAPNATRIFFISNVNDWQEREDFALKRLNHDGVWEVRFPKEKLKHEDYYRLKVYWDGGQGDRIPAYARRVVKDLSTIIFNAQVWAPKTQYQWEVLDFEIGDAPPLIYETHVGMAQEEGKVGTYREFTRNIIPIIAESGYNVIQLMAIPEHPYYGSFGYHVTNFFAASSQFGTPDEFKALVDAAHKFGIAVVIDLVHSHAAKNITEGISHIDGSPFLYFHDGAKGHHTAWDSRCFDYGRINVLHFLLSNVRFWLDEYKVDGFRFDGITSMLYSHHGLGTNFLFYDQYFDDSVDEDAIAYLTLANKLINEIKPAAITIAEDISGMPGIACPIENGGFGFKYRFAMGIPDLWSEHSQKIQDENWHVGHIWHELTNRRNGEATISYVESHDQAIVGDKTLIFSLVDADMYRQMQVTDENPKVDRGIALHKLIRLFTLATAGCGYLNFMGNEFGHPEWIDFPREGNNWSYHYARRQWSLRNDPTLKYKYLAQFDKDMLKLIKKYRILSSPYVYLVHEHIEKMILIFKRDPLIFVLNLHPTQSQTDYQFVVEQGVYKMVFNSDGYEYGGSNRLFQNQEHWTIEKQADTSKTHRLSLYIPTRTIMALTKNDL